MEKEANRAIPQKINAHRKAADAFGERGRYVRAPLRPNAHASPYTDIGNFVQPVAQIDVIGRTSLPDYAIKRGARKPEFAVAAVGARPAHKSDPARRLRHPARTPKALIYGMDRGYLDWGRPTGIARSTPDKLPSSACGVYFRVRAKERTRYRGRKRHGRWPCGLRAVTMLIEGG